MSSTEIFKITKHGDVVYHDETRNAWRGAMAIWGILEKRYLKPLPKPIWMSNEQYNDSGYTRSCIPSFGKERHPLQDVWDLVKNEEVSRVDKIVLSSTFDFIVIMKPHLHKIIEAFNSFDGETSLKEQAEILQNLLDSDDDFIGVAWNQTSVNGDMWSVWNKEKEECDPYDINTGEKHWDLFEDESI